MSERSRLKGRDEAAPLGTTEAGPSLWSNEWLIGLLLAVAIAIAYQQVWHAGFTLAMKRLSPAGRIAARSATACIVAVLAALKWRRCAMYADMETLWLTTIAGNPDC